MKSQIIKEFRIFKNKKTAREILNIFSDTFIDLEDMGGWLSFASNDRLYDIESEHEIEVVNNVINVEFKSNVVLPNDTREAQDQNQLYLFLQSNLDKLVESFEKRSGCEVKIGGQVNVNSDSGIHIVELKKNIWKSRIKWPDIDNLLKDNGEILNILVYFKVYI